MLSYKRNTVNEIGRNVVGIIQTSLNKLNKFVKKKTTKENKGRMIP